MKKGKVMSEISFERQLEEIAKLHNRMGIMERKRRRGIWKKQPDCEGWWWMRSYREKELTPAYVTYLCKNNIYEVYEFGSQPCPLSHIVGCRWAKISLPALPLE